MLIRDLGCQICQLSGRTYKFAIIHCFLAVHGDTSPRLGSISLVQSLGDGCHQGGSFSAAVLRQEQVELDAGGAGITGGTEIFADGFQLKSGL